MTSSNDFESRAKRYTFRDSSTFASRFFCSAPGVSPHPSSTTLKDFRNGMSKNERTPTRQRQSGESREKGSSHRRSQREKQTIDDDTSWILKLRTFSVRSASLSSSSSSFPLIEQKLVSNVRRKACTQSRHGLQTASQECYGKQNVQIKNTSPVLESGLLPGEFRLFPTIVASEELAQPFTYKGPRSPWLATSRGQTSVFAAQRDCLHQSTEASSPNVLAPLPFIDSSPSYPQLAKSEPLTSNHVDHSKKQCTYMRQAGMHRPHTDTAPANWPKNASQRAVLYEDSLKDGAILKQKPLQLLSSQLEAPYLSWSTTQIEPKMRMHLEADIDIRKNPMQVPTLQRSEETLGLLARDGHPQSKTLIKCDFRGIPYLSPVQNLVVQPSSPQAQVLANSGPSSTSSDIQGSTVVPLRTDKSNSSSAAKKENLQSSMIIQRRLKGDRDKSEAIVQKNPRHPSANMSATLPQWPQGCLESPKLEQSCDKTFAMRMYNLEPRSTRSLLVESAPTTSLRRCTQMSQVPNRTQKRIAHPASQLSQLSLSLVPNYPELPRAERISTSTMPVALSLNGGKSISDQTCLFSSMCSPLVNESFLDLVKEASPSSKVSVDTPSARREKKLKKACRKSKEDQCCKVDDNASNGKQKSVKKIFKKKDEPVAAAINVKKQQILHPISVASDNTGTAIAKAVLCSNESSTNASIYDDSASRKIAQLKFTESSTNDSKHLITFKHGTTCNAMKHYNDESKKRMALATDLKETPKNKLHEIKRRKTVSEKQQQQQQQQQRKNYKLTSSIQSKKDEIFDDRPHEGAAAALHIKLSQTSTSPDSASSSSSSADSLHLGCPMGPPEDVLKKQKKFEESNSSFNGSPKKSKKTTSSPASKEFSNDQHTKKKRRDNSPINKNPQHDELHQSSEKHIDETDRRRRRQSMMKDHLSTVICADDETRKSPPFECNDRATSAALNHQEMLPRMQTSHESLQGAVFESSSSYALPEMFDPQSSFLMVTSLETLSPDGQNKTTSGDDESFCVLNEVARSESLDDGSNSSDPVRSSSNPGTDDYHGINKKVDTVPPESSMTAEFIETNEHMEKMSHSSTTSSTLDFFQHSDSQLKDILLVKDETTYKVATDDDDDQILSNSCSSLPDFKMTVANSLSITEEPSATKNFSHLKITEREHEEADSPLGLSVLPSRNCSDPLETAKVVSFHNNSVPLLPLEELLADDTTAAASLMSTKRPPHDDKLIAYAHVIQLDVDDTLIPTSQFCEKNWLGESRDVHIKVSFFVDKEVEEIPEEYRIKLTILDQQLTRLFSLLHHMVIHEDIVDEEVTNDNKRCLLGSTRTPIKNECEQTSNSKEQQLDVNEGYTPLLHHPTTTIQELQHSAPPIWKPLHSRESQQLLFPSATIPFTTKPITPRGVTRAGNSSSTSPISTTDSSIYEPCLDSMTRSLKDEDSLSSSKSIIMGDLAKQQNSSEPPPPLDRIARNYVLSVIIMTNATMSHVRTVFPKFLPTLTTFFAEKQIFLDDLVCSARDLWGDEFPFEHFYDFWKCWTLEDVLSQLKNDGVKTVTCMRIHNLTDRYFNVISFPIVVDILQILSIGDDEPERKAAAYVRQEMPDFVKGLKLIKLVGHPEIEDISLQVEYIIKKLRQFVQQPNPFDVSLKLNPMSNKTLRELFQRITIENQTLQESHRLHSKVPLTKKSERNGHNNTIITALETTTTTTDSPPATTTTTTSSDKQSTADDQSRVDADEILKDEQLYRTIEDAVSEVPQVSFPEPPNPFEAAVIQFELRFEHFHKFFSNVRVTALCHTPDYQQITSTSKIGTSAMPMSASPTLTPRSSVTTQSVCDIFPEVALAIKSRYGLRELIEQHIQNLIESRRRELTVLGRDCAAFLQHIKEDLPSIFLSESTEQANTVENTPFSASEVDLEIERTTADSADILFGIIHHIIRFLLLYPTMFFDFTQHDHQTLTICVLYNIIDILFHQYSLWSILSFKNSSSDQDVVDHQNTQIFNGSIKSTDEDLVASSPPQMDNNCEPVTPLPQETQECGSPITPNCTPTVVSRRTELSSHQKSV